MAIRQQRVEKSEEGATFWRLTCVAAMPDQHRQHDDGQQITLRDGGGRVGGQDAGD